MPLVCRCLRLSLRLCLLLRPFVAFLSLSTLAGCCVTSCHATASRPPAPPPLIAPPSLIAPLLRLLSVWLLHRLSSHRRVPSACACASASHCTTTYYCAPLTPLVQLVVASPLVTLPPPVSLHLCLSSRLLSGWLLRHLLSCRCLCLSLHRRLSLHPSCASYPADCCCWVRYTHCSNYEARGASGNYKTRGASGNYKAWGASGDYKAWGASGGKYKT